MQEIIVKIGGIPESKSRNDDDFSDRLSHRYTTGVLVLFALVITSRQFVGEPIKCWVPAHFSNSHEEYTNSYCWIRNTFYLPFEDYIPKENESGKRHMIPYYQWIPMILLVQALLFYLPVIVWRSFNSRAGIDLNSVIEVGMSLQKNINLDEEKRKKTLKYITEQINRYLTSQQEYHTGCTVSVKHCLSRVCCLICGRRHGNYLVVLYIFCKLLYILNVIGQLFVLDVVLGTDYHFYGIDVITSLGRGDDWTQLPRFPRVTMCDFKVRRLGNLQRYTVQCVLPFNLFNEKMYLFIWFWMIFLAAVLCYSLLTWSIRSIFRVDRHRYIKKLLKKTMDKFEREIGPKFVDNYLRQDGVFIMQLVQHNTNLIIAAEIMDSLWSNYWEKRLIEKKNPEKQD